MRHVPGRRLFVWAALALLCAGAGTGCKSSPESTRVTVGVTPEFDAQTPTVSSNSISLEKTVVDGGRIVLDVVVTDVRDPISGDAIPVSGIALMLTYPGDIAKFSRCLDGDLFEPGTCWVSSTPKGVNEVFLGRSITSPEPAVPVSDSRAIVRIEFIVFGVGAGDIVFEGQNLAGGDASALLDDVGAPIIVDWFAGTLSGL